MSKITDYSAFTSFDAANDLLVGVDVSDTSMAASGTTKKLTMSQLGGASLLKFASASVPSIATGTLITGMSYSIPANSLAVGSSFRLVYYVGGGNAVLDLDTTSGTAGTSIIGASRAATLDFACTATGASGNLSYTGVFESATGVLTGTGTSSILAIDTTANRFIEVLNTTGGTISYTNCFMIVTAT